MSSFFVELPDGSRRNYPSATTAQAIAAEIGKRLEEAALAARIDGKLVDLTTPITQDCRLEIITRQSKEGLEVLRHSTAHLLAHAIKELYPETQITIGPVIEDGFYYDVDCPIALNETHLRELEKRMEEIKQRALPVHRKEVSKDNAVRFFKDQGEHYKAEIISGIPDPEVSLYEQGNFSDLCRGPHVPNTKRLGAFKLTHVSGAYWRGDEKNKMLQRIYGTAFATQKELDEHLQRLEEARKRDHRKLGVDLGLFVMLPEAPAMPFYLPKGTLFLQLLMNYIRAEMAPSGYQEVSCPQVMNASLWKKSGHWDHYRENMFAIEEEDEQLSVALKPMNCPGHSLLFGATKRSYRELPLRFAEFTRLHRNERGGVTHGLFRTRAFSQDDGHIFCDEGQIKSESVQLIKDIFRVYRTFDFTEVEVLLATRPESYLGTPERWDLATKALEDSLNEAAVPFKFAPGEGAFYGPKIEFHVKDSLKRSWQCGTIQLDFNFPERFQLEFMAQDGSLKRPVMIHRAIFGSFERFMGILIEHYAGHFPLWLAPVQAEVINVTDDQKDYADTVVDGLRAMGMRVDLDARNEKLGYKIREAQLKKIPYMIILGDKEKAAGKVSYRKSDGTQENLIDFSVFQESLKPLLNPGGKSH